MIRRLEPLVLQAQVLREQMINEVRVMHKIALNKARTTKDDKTRISRDWARLAGYLSSILTLMLHDYELSELQERMKRVEELEHELQGLVVRERKLQSMVARKKKPLGVKQTKEENSSQPSPVLQEVS